jgi:acyl-CoA dehydrogenase
VTSLLSKTNQNQAELALEWMLSRANDPRKMPFGKLLSEHTTIIEGIARSRIEIDAARLMALNAAHTIDETDAKTALKEVAEIKVLIPAMALPVIDRAVQSFGGEGISQKTPLAYMWAQARVLRLADGPDEVHIQQLGRRENKRGPEMLKKIQRQSEIADRLFLKYGKDTAWIARL